MAQTAQMITGITFSDSFNLLKQITGGAIDNNVGFIDPITKTYKEMSFSYTNTEDYGKLTFSKNAQRLHAQMSLNVFTIILPSVNIIIFMNIGFN